MKEIFLLRHGETDNNLYSTIKEKNPSLNMIGIEQSIITGKYLRDYICKPNYQNFDLVISSYMKRTIQTAEIICDIINYNPKDIIISKTLKNPNSKEKNKDYKIISKGTNNKKTDPLIEKRNRLFNTNTMKIVDEVNARKLQAQKVIKFIEKNNYKKILIVCHNGNIMYGFIPLLFNVLEINGDFRYGYTCHLSYIVENKKIYTLVNPPSTYHFKLLSNKNFSFNYGKRLKNLYNCK